MNDDSRIGYANQVYTKQLMSVLTEPIYNSCMDMYRKEANSTEKKNEILMNFQKRLKDVPNWNQNIINDHVQKASSNCNFLSDLLAAVYFSNIKILSSVKIKKSTKKIHVKIPELDSFIHQIYIELARKIYSNPKTFSVSVYGSEMDNYEIVYPIIHESVEEAIVKSLPFQNILQTYFGDKLYNDSSSDEEESDNDNQDEEDNENNGGFDSDNEPFNENINEENENNVESESEIPKSNGFFDRDDEEVKDVSIQEQGKNNLLHAQNPVPEMQADPERKPMFFKDAAEDPIEDEEPTV